MNGIVDRHATAMAEIQKLHDDYNAMRAELTNAYRKLDQQQNMIEVLTTDKERYFQERSLFQRKLIRLAAAMDHIGALSEEAQAIMRDSRDWEEQYDAEDQAARAAPATTQQPAPKDEELIPPIGEIINRLPQNKI